MIKAAALRKDGVIYTGNRHCDIFIQEPKGVLMDAEQGFVTTDGRFVDRFEALQIAKDAGQIVQKCGNQYELYSEDMLDFNTMKYKYGE